MLSSRYIALRLAKPAAGASGCVSRSLSTQLQQTTDFGLVRAGGRQSVSGLVVTVLGASGFLGRYVVAHLGQTGSQVIVPYRGDGYWSRHLKVSGDLGQIVPLPIDFTDKDSIHKAVSKSNVVINLIGNRLETMNFKYHDTHVKTTFRLAEVCKDAGIQRFIHMSAMGADLNSSSDFFRSKAEGEAVVKSFFPEATIFRPAQMFGEEDEFVNRLSDLINYLPATFDFGGLMSQKIQPVWVCVKLLRAQFFTFRIRLGPRRCSCSRAFDHGHQHLWQDYLRWRSRGVDSAQLHRLYSPRPLPRPPPHPSCAALPHQISC